MGKELVKLVIYHLFVCQKKEIIIKKCQNLSVETCISIEKQCKKMENTTNIWRKVLSQAENIMVFFIKRLL